MKVEDVRSTSLRPLQETRRKTEGEDFSSYLEQAMGEEERVGTLPEGVSMDATAEILCDERYGILTGTDMPGSRGALDALGSAMHDLDTFGALLSSNHFDAFAGDRIAQSFASVAVQDEVETGDEGLRQLAQETKICLFTEAIKWRRGDYL